MIYRVEKNLLLCFSVLCFYFSWISSFLFLPSFILLFLSSFLVTNIHSKSRKATFTFYSIPETSPVRCCIVFWNVACCHRRLFEPFCLSLHQTSVMTFNFCSIESSNSALLFSADKNWYLVSFLYPLERWTILSDEMGSMLTNTW